MLLPNLPYNVIGKLTVGVVFLVVSVLLLAIGLLLAYGAWYRVFSFLSSLMYRGYELEKSRPPRWRMRWAAVFTGLQRFEVTKIPAAIREVDEDLANDEKTLLNH